jgi:hypothetical protein
MALRILVFLSILVMLSSCATQMSHPEVLTPGFLLGLVHGLSTPFSFIYSWFADVRIYAYPNAGILYDAGYVTGLSVWSGVIWR